MAVDGVDSLLANPKEQFRETRTNTLTTVLLSVAMLAAVAAAIIL